MLFKSPIFSQASGSIGGTTFSRNRGGMYTRNRAIPTNPNTANQVAVRTYLGTAVNAWSNTLTPAQRAGWRAYGDNTPMTNKLGDETRLTGQQQFVRSFVAFSRAGATPVMNAPTIYNTGEPIVRAGNTALPPGQFDIVASVVGGELTFMGNPSEDGVVAVGLGPPVNDGVTYYGGRANHSWTEDVSKSNDDVLVPVNISGWPNPWAPIAVGQRRGLTARVLYDDGRVSEQFRTIIEFVAP